MTLLEQAQSPGELFMADKAVSDMDREELIELITCQHRLIQQTLCAQQRQSEINQRTLDLNARLMKRLAQMEMLFLDDAEGSA